jgi:membrane associated rhomboid family serine protease
VGEFTTFKVKRNFNRFGIDILSARSILQLHANFWGGVVRPSVVIPKMQDRWAGGFIKSAPFFRALVFPLLLGVIYFAQLQFPLMFKNGALWSDHPRWWQFFTNGFLSGNPVHLGINILGMWFVCSRFARQIRISFLMAYFVLFAAASSYLYYTFCMPSHATLVGASSGVYSLLGFLSWFFRKKRLEFFVPKTFAVPVLPLMAFTLVLEFFVARYWIPVLAWQLHALAFGLSIFTALLIHAVYSIIHWLAAGKPLNRVFIPVFALLCRAKEAVKVEQPVLKMN